MDIEQVPEKIKELTVRVDHLEYVLLFAGTCPRCGTRIRAKDQEDGKMFTCGCGLYHYLSNSAIKNLKQGKQITE